MTPKSTENHTMTISLSRREQDLKEAVQDARPVKQKTLRQQRSIAWRELKREALEKKQQQQTEQAEEEAQLLWLRNEEERLVKQKEKKIPTRNIG